MSDSDAVQRLWSIVMAAADGNRDIANDRGYKQLRKVAIGRTNIADVLPRYIRSQRDLNLLWTHLKAKGPRDRSLRRDYVAQTFKALQDRVEGRSPQPNRASAWTGKRSVQEQAQIVLTLAPTLFQAVDMLLDEQERPLHNGGPIEPEREDAIFQLRQLHEALGELISLAQQGRPFAAQLQIVRALKDHAFQWSQNTYELMVAQSPLMASSAVYGSAIWFLTNLISRDLDASATMAAGVVGATAITRGINKAK